MRMFRYLLQDDSIFCSWGRFLSDSISGYSDEGPPDVDHLVLIYLLYLLEFPVVSYLLIYKKKRLVDAHQMNYITVLYHNGFLVLAGYLPDSYCASDDQEFCFVSDCCGSMYHYRKYMYVQKSRCTVSLS